MPTFSENSYELEYSTFISAYVKILNFMTLKESFPLAWPKTHEITKFFILITDI